MKFLSTNFVSEAVTTITASSSDTSFPSSNLKHPFRSKRWRSTGCTEESVLFDLRTTEEIDSIVILWPKETGVRLTSSAVITIQANATNTWTAPAFTQVLQVNDSYEMASGHFTSVKNYRYWRLLITDPTNQDGYIELGVVWLGKSLSLQDTENGFKYNLVDRSKTVRTDYGHKYTDKYPKMSSISIAFKYLNYADVQVLENAFRINGTDAPVLFTLDPTGAMFDKDHFVLYGNMDAGFSLSHVSFDILNSDGIVIEELA